MTNQTDQKDLLDRIRAPLTWDQVEVKVQAVTKDQKTALPVLYMDARAATRRLNEVFGLGWSTEMRELREGDRIVGVECRLSFELNGRHFVRTNVGEPSEGDNALKGAYSDALKRTLAQLGCDCLYGVQLPWVAYTGNKYEPFDPQTLARIQGLYEMAVGLRPPFGAKAVRQPAASKPDTTPAPPSPPAAPTAAEASVPDQPAAPKPSGGITDLFRRLQIGPEEANQVICEVTGRKFFSYTDAGKRMNTQDRQAVLSWLVAKLQANALVPKPGEAANE